MGAWYIPLELGETIEAWAEKEFSDAVDFEIVDHVVYVAHAFEYDAGFWPGEPVDSDREPERIRGVEARVYPIEMDGHGFWLRCYYESGHPFYYQCPVRILEQLTPTRNKNAAEWRGQCMALANPGTAGKPTAGLLTMARWNLNPN